MPLSQSLTIKKTEQALLTDASKIADGLGAPGGDASWEYSGADFINCGGTSTYGCTTTVTTTGPYGRKTHTSAIEYSRGAASPGTHNIVWRAGQGKLMTFKTGLERAVFVTLHERAHVAQAGGSSFNQEFFANKEAMTYYEKWQAQ